MATISPTLSITANASSASTPGPLSFALSLSATKALTVDRVVSETKVIGTGTVLILDGSTLLDVDSDSGQPGEHGGFLYLRNITSSDLDIYVALAPDGTTPVLGSNDDADRSFTLKQNEFAFLPWDCTGDLIASGEGTCTLEYFFFNRG
jgi:hypothetical protein|tara:strand:+ start:283 stop:729 length:447 start_codon:yes stop_codon:yes gene_type:complete